MRQRNTLSEDFESFLVRTKRDQAEADARLFCRGKGLPGHPVGGPNWWDQRRDRSLALAGYRCEACGNGQEWMLQMHHIDYTNKRAERELDTDVEIVCTPCHKLKHPGKDFNFRGPDGVRY